MSKTEKSSKLGFVIKLSNETAQKLADEELQAKTSSTADIKEPETIKDDDKEVVDESSDPAQNSGLSKPEGQVDTKNVTEKPSDSKQKGISNSEPPKSGDNPTSEDYAQHVTYEGEEAIYTDPMSQQKFTWDKTSNSWTPKTDAPGREYSYEGNKHIYTETDGSKCFYDVEKKAWIPLVDDDFLAMYQMSYGFVDNTDHDAKKEEEQKKLEQKKLDKLEQAGQKRKTEPTWFEQSEELNTKVYVSNLPLDTTEEEFVDLMQKCGLVMRDPSTQKMKIKMYMDKEQNCFKGDALCTYIKIESVNLALNLIDGSDFKGNKIKVERASFQLKGDYNPALKPKKKKKKELEKLKRMQEKLFDWRPEKIAGEKAKHEKVVILKNLFHPSDFDKEVQLILDYQQDLREECGKCGEVRKVVMYDRHPEGVAQVTMKEPEEADAVVALCNGRWFGKRQLTAEIWDGRTKYRIAETDSEINKRKDNWEQFLEGAENKASVAGASDVKAEGTAQTYTGQEDKVVEKTDDSEEQVANVEAKAVEESDTPKENEACD